MDKYSTLYESNPDINILDMSATGSGKTGSAIKHIDHLVTHGKCAISAPISPFSDHYYYGLRLHFFREFRRSGGIDDSAFYG